MTANRRRIGQFLAALSLLAGCGGTITGNGGPDGATTTIPCSAMGACACREASDRCAMRTEACWCDSECDPSSVCKCGGGRFLACDDNAVVASCTRELAAVQTKCPTGGQYISDIDICSSSRSPSCVASCLANLQATGSCSELNCFCPVCDCIAPETPTFSNCLAACDLPLPD